MALADIKDSQYHTTLFRPAIALLAVSFALRIATPVALPSGDEAITIEVVRRYGTVELLWAVPTIQPHFPAYYVLLDLWGMVFPLESARYLSVAAGALVPVVAVAWFRELMDDQRAMVAGLLLAFSPPLIVQAHWLRMYALLSLAVLVSWWAAWSFLRGDRPAWQYGLAAAATLSLHPLGVAAVGAQLAWLAIEQYKTTLRRGFLTIAGTIGLFSAVLMAPLAARILGLTGGYSIGPADLHIRYATTPVVQAVTLPLATITGTAITWPFVALLAGVTLAVAWLVARRRLWSTRTGRLALCWILASMVILYIGHAVRPIILLKYVCWMAPAVALLFGMLADSRAGRSTLVGLAGVYVPNLVLGLVFSAHIAMVAVWESGVLASGSL